MNPSEIVTKQDLISFKEEVLSAIKSQYSTPSIPQKKILRSSDVRKILGISSGTLQTLRINKILPFSKVNGMIFYSYEDVLKVLEVNKI